MMKIDFVKQSNASKLFVTDVQTFDFSDESGLCEAIKCFLAVRDTENSVLFKQVTRSSTTESCKTFEP
jgi:hypothetical protein